MLLINVLPFQPEEVLSVFLGRRLWGWDPRSLLGLGGTPSWACWLAVPLPALPGMYHLVFLAHKASAEKSAGSPVCDDQFPLATFKTLSLALILNSFIIMCLGEHSFGLTF